jgi:hypothetical protein
MQEITVLVAAVHTSFATEGLLFVSTMDGLTG